MHDLPLVISLDRTSSTNSHLANKWRKSGGLLPPFLTVVTDFQESGRGRLGREWVAPTGTSLLASILMPTAADSSPLLPLAAGVVVLDLVQSLLPGRDVRLKWPNDVLVEGKKVSGILCEQLSPERVIVGIGINLSQTADQLPPVPSTSIALEGGPAVARDLLALSLATSLQDLAEVDPVELRALIEPRCSTLGHRVLASLPTGTTLEGRAVCLEPDGALRIEDLIGGEHIVRVGDVSHLRMSETAPELARQGGRS